MKRQVVSRVARKDVPKTIASLERWAKTLDVFYVRDFGMLLKPLEELDIDVSKARKAWESEDWHELSTQQMALMRDWEEDLTAKQVRIPRCAVYFFSTMDRKRYGVRREAFGDCDRHVTRLNLYELIISCLYRQANQHNLFRDHKLVADIMYFHRPWFQWMTDIQRLIIWTRRREYENIAGFKPMIEWKVERLSCSQCRKRYTGLLGRMTRSYSTVCGYGRPFNPDNYYGEIGRDELALIQTLRRLKEQSHGGS